MSIWKSANPTGAIADFIEVYRQAGSNRFRIGLIAGLCTFGMFSIMMTQSWKKERKLPDVTYINSWPLDRTPEETRDFIQRNQKLKEAQEKIQAANAAEEQKLWMTLGKVSGMDVDAIKAKAEAEKAAAKAKAEAEAKARLAK